jgi:hypothetical protein
MSRMSRASAEEESGARFRRVLAEVGRARTHHAEPAAEEAEHSNFPSRPLAGASFALDANAQATTGGGSHWDAALAWIEEQDEPIPAPEPTRAVEATPESVAEELGALEDLGCDALNRVRRLYMWRHHPDRRGEGQRDIATRRVAIANMLLDRAQARVASGRKT